MALDYGYRVLAGKESKDFCTNIRVRDHVWGLLPSMGGQPTLWIYNQSILDGHICDRVISNFSPTIYEFYRSHRMYLPRSTWYQTLDDRFHLVLQFRYPLEIVEFMAIAGLHMPFREIMKAIDQLA